MKLPRSALLCAAGLLSACSPGLDLYTPPDAREFVASCARGVDAVACRALLPTLQSGEGEVTVLLVNASDADIKAQLGRELSRKGVSLGEFLTSAEAGNFARAHIFQASRLQTGEMRTLDGKLHDVACRTEGQTEYCRVDGRIEGFNRLDREPGRKGSVYLMTGLLPF
ncbi:hypothetical protein Dcar01_02760 [Deinococcus carri]|uniref:Lipoprotein n=1 Tax=Deinococcus carri TaxID=1211323 RepID=A0ABP9WAF0_9DEIO